MKSIEKKLASPTKVSIDPAYLNPSEVRRNKGDLMRMSLCSPLESPLAKDDYASANYKDLMEMIDPVIPQIKYPRYSPREKRN